MWLMSRMSRSALRCSMSAASTVRLRLVDDELAPGLVVERVGDGEDVFVATTGLIDQDRVAGAQVARFLERSSEGVRRFECGDDAFLPDGQRQRVHDFPIGRSLEAHAPSFFVVRQNRRYAHVV